MRGNRIILYIFIAFVAGNLLLIYIHYNSVKSVDNLIGGNEKLINEIKVGADLRELEKNITSVETRIGNTIYTRDSSALKGLDSKIKEIETNIDNLQRISDDDISIKYIDTLDLLVHEKLSFSENALNVYHVSGKEVGERMINSSKGKVLNDSIIKVIRIIRKSRQDILTKTTRSIDKSGKSAQEFGTALIVLVLMGGMGLFWFIINTFRKQSDLIHRLHISERKVKEESKIKDYFMANISHEIRTPMNAILGFANLLQLKELDRDAKEYVRTIQDSGERLLTIINDILDLSKIEAGMMHIESAPFSIRALLDSTIAMFKVKLSEKRLAFYFYIDETIPDILEGDTTRLTQILMNLIGNSLKFTDRGHISLKISNEGPAEKGINIGITIADTGVGIEKDKLHRIFERFHQAESSITRKYGGTGLGLSIVYDLVQLQHGTITVKSQPSEGTSFHIVIPYITSNEDFSEQHTSGVDPSLHAFDNTSVLVVEDNLINQSLIKHLFTNWHLKYEMANNGREAVEKLSMKQYDLIFMDIQMPEMDGYAATRDIRGRLQINTPIIAMTAHALTGEREKCISCGMNEYISKPIRVEQLYNLLTQFVIAPSGIYEYINLDYMKEVSAGNIEYERTVTLQFIASIPEELLSMKMAWNGRQLQLLQQLAHNMKTSVSVMGLNPVLQPHLDAIEYDTLNEDSFYSSYAALTTICETALVEARDFYDSLS